MVKLPPAKDFTVTTPRAHARPGGNLRRKPGRRCPCHPGAGVARRRTPARRGSRAHVPCKCVCLLWIGSRITMQRCVRMSRNCRWNEGDAHHGGRTVRLPLRGFESCASCALGERRCSRVSGYRARVMRCHRGTWGGGRGAAQPAHRDTLGLVALRLAGRFPYVRLIASRKTTWLACLRPFLAVRVSFTVHRDRAPLGAARRHLWAMRAHRGEGLRGLRPDGRHVGRPRR
jgi:hypothetical protein